MLSAQENEYITRIGPGTLMGNLMRQYWLPMATSTDLEADGPPVRIRLLGEDLVAFRTTSGKVGLMDHVCPHRGTSLFYGRNEEEGLRCIYHGWKYDVSGACVDMPGEPPENNFASKVTTTAYPCTERNGVIWAYMGPRDTPPPLPSIEANTQPDKTRVSRTLRYCNWLQALEGDVDTLHSEYLHGPAHVDVASMKPGSSPYYRHRLREQFKYDSKDSPFGTSYGAYRPAEEGTTYWRTAHYLFPFYTLTPTPAAGSAITMRIWVPVDDDHVVFWIIAAGGNPSTDDPGSARAGDAFLPDTDGWLGRHRTVQQAENDYQIDREFQKNVMFAGIKGSFMMHDVVATESMGVTTDRSREHLGVSDEMIIRTRRRMLEAARALEDGNVAPPGVDDPDVYVTRSGWMILPNGADWWEALQEAYKSAVAAG
ncbi:MAG: Rieske 2Fe-2S domain-containing protein [Dehalococcoidia bacterium]